MFKNIPLSSFWFISAPRLADWTLARLVNRTDAWGNYYSGGQLTRYGYLDRELLIRHYRARSADDVIGLHTADADNRGKWGALDIDQHGDDPGLAESNRKAALHWYDALVQRGFRPLLTASNGNGGFHLRLLLAEPIDAARIFCMLRQLTTDHAALGLKKPPEQFPKQLDVRKCAKKLGNWLRIPGRHHKRHYWTDLWDGQRWLSGLAVIGYILSLTGDDPALVPEVPPPAPPPAPLPPRRAAHVYTPGSGLAGCIAAYMARLPNLAEGQGRDDVAFGFAAWLVRDMAIDDNVALEWLERWDSGNTPPKGRDRLAAILQNAHDYGQRPMGCGRRPNTQRNDRHGHRILKVRAHVS